MRNASPQAKSTIQAQTGFLAFLATLLRGRGSGAPPSHRSSLSHPAAQAQLPASVRPRRRGMLALTLALASLALLLIPSLASAAGHEFLEDLGSANQPTFGTPLAVAVDQTTEDVLVMDTESDTISRWNPDGTPADFSALGTNVIDGSETPEGELNIGAFGEVQIAVDNSGGPTEGRIYVPQATAGPEEEGLIDIFGPDGSYLGQITETSEGKFGEPCGVAVDPDGNLYVGDFGEAVHKFANPPVSGESTEFAFESACNLAAGAGPTEGFLFAAHYLGSVAKLDATSGAEELEVSGGEATTLALDPANGHVLVVRGSEIAEFDASGPASTEVGSPISLASPGRGVAANGSSGNLYATREGFDKVEVFGPLTGHHFLEDLGSANQPTFGTPLAVAVDQTTEDVLVMDTESDTISRWNPDGTPADFSALGTNVIDGSETPEGELNIGAFGEVQIAVDNSGGPTEGRIYVPQATAGPEEEGLIDIFGPDGSYLGQITETSEGKFGEPCGVAVDPDGNLYVGDFGEAVHKFANPPVSGESTEFAFESACNLAAGAGPTEGFLFAAHYLGSVAKLDATSGAEELEVSGGEATTLALDPANGHVLVVRGSEIAEFDASGPASTEVGSPIPLASPGRGVAANGSSGNLYATREGFGMVEVFAPGPPPGGSFELKVEKTGNGSGTVTSSPPGIDCGAECAAEFTAGEEVELQATPDAGSAFTGWSAVAGDPGTCTETTSPCTVTLSEALELEAEFALLPTVTALSPTAGPTAGGNEVVISGTDLTGATKVEFGTTTVNAPFTENTATTIKLNAPGHAAGALDVIVTTAGGASANTAADDYTYVAAPAITALSPAAGPTAGGNEVVISGTDLTGATKVEFGTTAVNAPFAENTATTIKLNVPGHAAGALDVIVTTAGGASANTAADDYTYVAAPAITALSPAAGPTAGGNEVVISGTDLTGATKVEFGTTAVNAPFAENTATTIKLNVPGHAAGAVDVIVTTAGGASADTAADDYTYVAPPAVTGLEPAQGPTAGGNEVVITGLRLSAASQVQFGDVVVEDSEFTENTATTIKLEAPGQAAGTVDVRVTTIGGTSGDFAADDYTYVAPPTVTTTPGAAPLAQTTATVAGTVNPNSGALTGCRVEYGPTAAYGSEAPCATLPGGGSSPVNVSAALGGLSAATTYHFRFAATNLGGTGVGSDQTFTTLADTCETKSSLCPVTPPSPVQCAVPKLKGKTLKQAKSALAKAHCKAGKVSKPKKKKGKKLGPLVVKSSKPGPGTTLPADSKVGLKMAPKPKKKH